MANGAKVTSGWTDAYEVDFTAGGGDGDRPIVTSYSSSPPFTIPEGETQPTTSALLDTCFRQVEYAGVLEGLRQPGRDEEVHRLHAGAGLPGRPAGQHVRLSGGQHASSCPSPGRKFAQVSPEPIDVSPTLVTEKRADWLREWRDITSQ